MGRLICVLVCNAWLVAFASDCASSWPDGQASGDLNDFFEDPVYLGAGASACVWKAKSKETGQDVAVKLSKVSSDRMLEKWKEECRGMQDLRLTQCKTSQELLKLGEMFVPTCLGAWETPSHVSYMVQHLAPKDGIATCHPKGVEDRKKVLAELVAGVFSLHGAGYTHNDLHGTNIVVDMQPSPPELAIIDLGEIVPIKKGTMTNYKRDGNALWKWGAQIAGCGSDAQWNNDEQKMRSAKPKFLKCLKSQLGAGSDFIEAFSLVIDADIAKSVDQHVSELYHTTFVYENLPPFKNLYHWSRTSSDSNPAGSGLGCLDEWYRSLFKCDTLQTYSGATNTAIFACGKKPSQAACFSMQHGMTWACDSEFAQKCTSSYYGSCLFPGHEGYSYAKDGSHLEIVTSTTTTTVTSTTTTSTTTTSTTTTTTSTTEESNSLLLFGVVAAGAALVVVIVSVFCRRRGAGPRNSQNQPLRDERTMEMGTSMTH